MTDPIRGGAGRDLIVGGDGGDRAIYGDGGRDRIYGGAGNDLIITIRDKNASDLVDCGPGASDVALVDREDRVRDCEELSRKHVRALGAR